MSVKKQAAVGMLWSAIERFSTQGVQFVLTIIIARILSPNDYGLIAMLGIFMSIAQTLSDSGFSNALIQKKNRTEMDYCTIFYFNIAISVLIYLILFFTAPYISDFYGQPQLMNILRVLGLNLIIISFSVIQSVRFTIELDFKRLTLASFLSTLIGGGVGIWMAYHGFGVWTLVIQSLISSVSWSFILWLHSRWLPKWKFSLSSFKDLFSFGSKLMFSGLLHTFYTNMYSLIIGKFFNASTLGFFNRAYTLGLFPVQNFSYIIQKVLFSVQCRYQDDEKKFDYIFTQNIKVSCYILFPLMVGLAVLAEPLIRALLTEKWLPAVPLLQIICFAQMWDPIMRINAMSLVSKGRSDYHLQAEIIKKILAVLILFSTLPFGIRAICFGMLVYAFVDMVVVIGYSRRIIGLGYVKQFKILLGPFFLALSMGLVVFISTYLIINPVYKLIAGVSCGSLYYLAFSYVLKLPELKLLLTIFKEK